MDGENKGDEKEEKHEDTGQSFKDEKKKGWVRIESRRQDIYSVSMPDQGYVHIPGGKRNSCNTDWTQKSNEKAFFFPSNEMECQGKGIHFYLPEEFLASSGTSLSFPFVRRILLHIDFLPFVRYVWLRVCVSRWRCFLPYLLCLSFLWIEAGRHSVLLMLKLISWLETSFRFHDVSSLSKNSLFASVLIVTHIHFVSVFLPYLYTSDSFCYSFSPEK